MDKLETHYCKTCAVKAFSKWKGRPHKDVLPLLPKIVSGTCQRCSGAESISSYNIAWLSHKNEDAPAYCTLVEVAYTNDLGLPYFSEMRCPKCQQRSIVSEVNLPDGGTEYKCNCQLCGIVDIG